MRSILAPWADLVRMLAHYFDDGFERAWTVLLFSDDVVLDAARALDLIAQWAQVLMLCSHSGVSIDLHQLVQLPDVRLVPIELFFWEEDSLLIR